MDENNYRYIIGIDLGTSNTVVSYLDINEDGNESDFKIFDIPIGYGIADAMENKNIKVSPTPINNLYLMTAGNCVDLKPGIEHTLVLRQILQTLKDEFVFIVVDMTSILPINEFPVHFINEIDGLISVIDSTRTKKNDFNKIFKHLDEQRFVGYVFNKMKK